MTGPVEEAGRAANTFMESLKSQPLSLALVAMNLALLGFVFYDRTEINKNRNEYVLETQRLLARCLTVEEIEKLERLRGGQGR